MTTTAPIAIELEQASLVVPAYEQADRSARSLTTGLLTAAFDPPQRTHRVLLDAIDLSVRDGERVAVLGGNGAGKSTLLRMVAGAYTPSSGTVRIQGRMQALLNVSLGFNVDATVRENIYLRGAAMGLSLREIHSLAPSVLEFAGLAGRAGDRLRVLSAGQRMRLSFAVTTVQQTDIMVMDEWIGTGDAEFFDKARERLKGRVDSARIVLLASHSVPLLMQVCERAIYLREGRLIASGDLLDVVEEFIPQALPPKRPKPVELDPEVEARRIAELEAQRDAQRSATLAAMRRRARSDVEKESRAARAEFARAQKAHARKEEVQAKRETHLRIRELQLKEQGDMIRAAREALERAREQQTRAREAHAQALEVRLRAAREFQAPAVEPPGAPLVQEPARESPEPAQEPPPSPSSRDALEQQRLAQLQTLRDAAHAERKREVRAEMERTARAEIVQAARMAQAMAGGEAAFAERKREVRAEMERAAREAQAHAGHDGPALAVREVVRGATVAIAGPAEQVAPNPNAVPATAANDAFHSHESDNANVNTMNHTNNEAGDNTAADVAPVATTPQAGIEAGEADTPVAPSAEDAPAGDVAVAAPPPVVEVKSSCDPSGTLLSTPVFRQGVQPIFIIGAPRSATSMLTWAIGQHPNIQPMPETAWIASLAVGAANSHALGASRGRFSHLSNVGYPLEPFLRRLGESVHDIVHDCFEERCHLCYGDFRKSGKLQMAPDSPNPGMHLRQSLNEPKRRWIDGTPLNSHYSWALAEMFPEARFIHSLRRPDEVATSLEGFANVGADPQELSEGLRTWCQHTEAAWLAERAFGAERVFRLHFTRISSEPETMIRDLTAFLGEEFAPASMRPLSRRLNSSKVDDKRAANLERLQELPAFIAAQELYAAVLDTPPAEPDAVALGALRARFLSLCEGRTLV